MRRALAGALIVAAALGCSTSAATQLSPRRTAEGDIDGVHITIEYGSPSKRGREIWGGLRPWDVVWMPGADLATSIKTSGPLVIGTLKVPAGAHTIYTLPNEKETLLIINREVGQFHTEYRRNMDLGRTAMTLKMLETPVESMTFAVSPHDDGGGSLSLSWDDREYSVEVKKQ
jgi:hypothetical protein